MSAKIPYICGPLTELPDNLKQPVRDLYICLANVCEETIGVRAFVPHEHFDPVIHSHFTPQEVDAAERRKVCEETSLLIVVAVEPTWGGGIEVEMANRSRVPIVMLKPAHKKISRLLLGNPGVRVVREYSDNEEAVVRLKAILAAGFSWVG